MLISDDNMRVNDAKKMILFQKGFLGQWYPSRFYENGVLFSCAEQYMMYRKAMLFGDLEAAFQLIQTHLPHVQQGIGRTVRNFDPKKWDDNKADFVIRGNLLKFGQNENIRQMLFETEDYTLVEAAPWDKVWGIGLGLDDPNSYDCNKWLGENLLGYSIMRVRADLLKIERGDDYGNTM